MNFLNLTDAQSVVLKTLIFCVLSVLLVLIACICMLVQIKIDATLFNAAATFVFAVGGISSGSFLTQRLTDWTYVDKKGQAAAKIAEATKPSTVSVASPAAVITSSTPGQP